MIDWIDKTRLRFQATRQELPKGRNLPGRCNTTSLHRLRSIFLNTFAKLARRELLPRNVPACWP